jgi:hypothetical protein
VNGMLPPWDRAGIMSPLLPEWAMELSLTCGHYTFSRMKVWDGWSVVAVKSGDGRGPSLVITSDEAEMRTALGLKSSQPES